MNQGPFSTALAFFLDLNKSCLFKDFVEKHIVDFIRDRRRDIKALNYAIILLNKLLSNISLVI